MSFKSHLCFLLVFLVLFSPVSHAQSSFIAQQYKQKISLKKQDTQNAEGFKKGVASNFRFGSSSVDYQVHLLGQVETPGTYRLAPSTRLDEALSKAGGAKKTGSLRQIEIKRGGKILTCDIFKFHRYGDLEHNPFLMDNDVVFIPFVENSVSINGAVKSEGVYELKGDGKTIWALIEMAGGFTPGFDEGQSFQVVRFVQGKKELIPIESFKSQLASFELQDGDVVVVPHVFTKDRRFDYDVPELPADNIFYPTQKQEVFVIGAVANPGPIAYHPTTQFRDYVNSAGPTVYSNIEGAYIMTDGGKYVRGTAKESLRLSPGDTIVVPLKKFTTDNVLKWYGTLSSSIFTGYALRELVRN